MLYRLVTSLKVSNCSMSGVHEQLFPVICPRAAPSQLFGCKTVPTESTVSSRSPDAVFSRDLPTPPTASSPPLLFTTGRSALAFTTSPNS